MTQMIGSNLGGYRILEQIGMGGMATVYKAFDPGMERHIALKVLPARYSQDPEFVERFKREARVIANLEHPNILPVYSFGEQDGTTYLAMRYLPTGTLKDLLLRGSLSLETTSRLISAIAAALDFAHARNVIHRDIKPSNILVDGDGVPYLMDFGLAKMLEGTTTLTSSGAVLGTPEYMAPEQALGLAPTAQSDIYALGVMLYEMVTGQVPFQADTPLAVALKHVHDPLPLPREVKPELSPQIETVILKALAKEPSERYAKASDLARAFDEAIREEPAEEVVSSGKIEAGRPMVRSRRRGWFAAAGILIVVVILGAVFLRPKPASAPLSQSPPEPSGADGSYQIGRTLFEDDFEGTPNTLWDYQWGPWERGEAGGNTFMVADLEQAQEARIRDSDTWSDYLLRFDMMFSHPNPSGFYLIGVKTRIAPCSITHDQYYEIAFAPDLVKFVHDDCGTIVQEQVFDLSLAEEAWHTFELYNYADRFQLAIDGDPIADLRIEDPVPQGGIGFENYEQGQVYYLDNVGVYELESTEGE